MLTPACRVAAPALGSTLTPPDSGAQIQTTGATFGLRLGRQNLCSWRSKSLLKLKPSVAALKAIENFSDRPSLWGDTIEAIFMYLCR
jgi:hypothetical protein